MLKSIINFLKEVRFTFNNTSYSQAGEDAIIRYLFGDYGLTEITYLDIGTNSPIIGNNTYWFYKNGSKGVCVEADSTLINLIKLKRPKDKILNVGVSISKNSFADFYVFNQPAINTFDKFEAEKRLQSGLYNVIKVEKVALMNINDIISNNFNKFPDFLSLDIEGLDLDVLKSLDLNKYPIPVICVETCRYSESYIRPKDLDIIDFLTTNGYFIYADTYLNTIFVNNKWFYNH
jgi:FkbM family methyltransferase